MIERRQRPDSIGPLVRRRFLARRPAASVAAAGGVWSALLLVGLLAAAVHAEPPRAFGPSDVRGVSWSDPRDNYNPSLIVPAGLSPTDTPERAAGMADAVATRTLAVGANTVRLGINPPTIADPAWWAVYQRAVRTLAGRGVKVILCAWEQSPTVQGNGRGGHDGRFGAGSVASYAAMWKAVHASLRDEPNVLAYELLNEPFGYRGKADDYVRDMRTLIDAIGPLDGKHVMVSGLGYSDDVRAIAGRFPEPDIWFAYHVYPNWFGGEAGRTVFTRQQYADNIAEKLAGVEARTVVTEFGCWGGDAYDYAKPSDQQATRNAKRHVAYLHGVADACARLNLGSVYWFADARETRDRPAYDLLARDGRPQDADKMAEVRRAWRLPAE